MTCDESGLKSQIDSTATLDAAALAAVTSAIVVRVSDCEASDVSSAQASGSAEAIRTAMEANSVISSAVQGLGATPADVIGGMLTETMLTVYVEATP